MSIVKDFILILKDIVPTSAFFNIILVFITIVIIICIGKFFIVPSMKRNAEDADRYYKKLQVCEKQVDELKNTIDKLKGRDKCS